MNGYQIASAETAKLAGLYEKYGLTLPGMNSMNFAMDGDQTEKELFQGL